MAKIYLNPGHGGKDTGAVGVGGRPEKDDNLKFAKAVYDMLRLSGHEIKLERSYDTYISVTEIARRANFWGADLFIAFHRNAYNGTASGAETLIAPNASLTSRKAAQLIANGMAHCGFKNRGVKVQGTNTYVLSHTTMPAVTIEAGFIDSTQDNTTFDNSFSCLVKETADAILAVAEELAPSDPFPPKQPDTTIPPLSRVLKLASPMMRGEDVRMAQERLNIHRASPGRIDGIFGQKTHDAVVAFQAARIKEGRDVGARYNGNRPDGKIGQLTWAILWE